MKLKPKRLPKAPCKMETKWKLRLKQHPKMFLFPLMNLNRRLLLPLFEAVEVEDPAAVEVVDVAEAVVAAAVEDLSVQFALQFPSLVAAEDVVVLARPPLSNVARRSKMRSGTPRTGVVVLHHLHLTHYQPKTAKTK
jgi:hypothetical protein